MSTTGRPRDGSPRAPMAPTAKVEVGIALFPQHRGRGIGTEAQRQLVRYIHDDARPWHPGRNRGGQRCGAGRVASPGVPAGGGSPRRVLPRWPVAGQRHVRLAARRPFLNVSLGLPILDEALRSSRIGSPIRSGKVSHAGEPLTLSATGHRGTARFGEPPPAGTPGASTRPAPQRCPPRVPAGGGSPRRVLPRWPVAGQRHVRLLRDDLS